MKKSHFWISVVSILLASCVTSAPHQNNIWQAQRDWQTFNASGRLGVKMGQQGGFAYFEWTRKNGVETFDLNTPIGTTLGQLCQDAQGALALDSKNHRYQAHNAEELSLQLLGYALPVQHLSVWANGEWLRDEPHSLDNSGRLQQLGWRITRETNQDDLPHILLLENDKMSIRFIFHSSERHAGLPEKTEQCAAREEH